MSLNKNRIFSAFFLVYFTISIFDAYFIIYIPLYYLNVLNVNRAELAFIQSITYLTLFVTPLLGLFYDKFIKKESRSKIIIYFFCIALSGSFLIFILYKEILLLYGVFVLIYFFSKSMIRTGMISLFLNVVKGSKKIKLNIILLVNTATIAGYLLISLIFNLNVLKITSIEFWDSFFILGWLFSVPIIIVGNIFNYKVRFFDETASIENKLVTTTQVKPIRYEIIIMGILYFSYILVTSDLMISYPLSSWIFEKFNEFGFRIYSSFYFVFFICSILGLYIANQMCKNYDEKKILCIFTYLYMVVLLPIAISSFPMFMILNSALSIIAYTINVVYTSIVTDFSNKGKYRTFKYQFLHTSSSFANMLFIPLGTLSFGIINIEILIIISGIMIGISGLFTFSTILIDRRINLNNQRI